MKRIKVGVVLVIFCLLLTIIIPSLSIADVGNFESYDSSSSYSSSDWGFSNDTSSSSYDGRSSVNSKLFYWIVGLFFGSGLIISIMIIIYETIRRMKIMIQYRQKYKEIVTLIKKNDEYFSGKKFMKRAKKIFIHLQKAWSKRDWESIRIIESESLFEMHSRQLQDYINREQINVMEKIRVNSVKLNNYSVDNENETLVVDLTSTMRDFIIDEKTGAILKGNKYADLTNTYKLSFIRKNGVKTINDVNEINCPNCGALTKINLSGKCEYCGSIITTSQHDWVLNDMERY